MQPQLCSCTTACFCIASNVQYNASDGDIESINCSPHRLPETCRSRELERRAVASVRIDS